MDGIRFARFAMNPLRGALPPVPLSLTLRLYLLYTIKYDFLWDPPYKE